jgi:excisionase family DNA binding protein
MGERLIDVAVVARVLKVCAETVRNWIRAKKLIGIKQGSGFYKIPASELQRLKESQKVPNPRR